MKLLLDQEYPKNAIRTYTGKIFDLAAIDPDVICIEDIAHALGQTTRFGGHLNKFYSVAQHSVLVSELVPKEHKKAALLHDASEAYLGDMPSPFKKLMPEYKAIETELMHIIADKFDFQYPLHPVIKEADELLLAKEWNTFIMGKDYIKNCWDYYIADFKFKEAYRTLTGEWI